MTPEQQAKELVERFKDVIPYKGFMFDEEKKKYAKQCALICVDVILNRGFDDRLYLGSNDEEYWEEVKQEIKKQ